jgi:glycosyltransferase involved in cell wall biosynthesis
MRYSAVIVTKNEAANILECIASAKGASEVVVVDDDSSDDTVALAQKAGAKVFKRRLDGFANQKNFGIDQTASDWVLILDADERLTPQLANEIASLKPRPSQAGYEIAFRNYVGKKWLRHGGLYPDYHIRLFNKKLARYGPRQVHERLSYQGEIDRLQHDIIHFTYRNFQEYQAKVRKYAPLEAQSESIKPSLGTVAKTFYWKYIKERGFLDGLAGLASAWLLMYYQYLKRQSFRK